MFFQGGITEEEIQEEAVQQEVCQYIKETGGVNKLIELSQVIDFLKTVPTLIGLYIINSHLL